MITSVIQRRLNISQFIETTSRGVFDKLSFYKSNPIDAHNKKISQN